MELEIKNISDLRTRIAYLELKKKEDEIYLAQRYHSVKDKFTKPFKFIKDSFESLNLFSGNANPAKSDIVTQLGRILFPLILNKTVLRNKGFVFKTLVSLLSQRTIKPSVFNKEVLSGWIDKVTDLIKSKTTREKRYGKDDYGIPPESETA